MLDRPDSYLRAAIKAEAIKDLGHMIRDGTLGHDKSIGDLGVGEAERDQRGDFVLAMRQLARKCEPAPSDADQCQAA